MLEGSVHHCQLSVIFISVESRVRSMLWEALMHPATMNFKQRIRKKGFSMGPETAIGGTDVDIGLVGRGTKSQNASL